LSLKKTSEASHAPTRSGPNDATSEILSRISDEILDLPAYVSELNRLLSSVPVDLKRVGKVIREHPKLAHHIIHLCKLTMPAFRDQNASVDHGIVFLGTSQMRTLIMACCMVLDIGSCYSSNQLRSFWRHGLLTASLSERIANYLDYPRSEDACRAGLFHDAGALALARWAGGTRSTGEFCNAICGENTHAERKNFGTDHCVVGGLLGRAWGLPEEIVDVLEFHHDPQASKCDPILVGIVAAADRYCVGRGIRFQLVEEQASEPSEDGFDQLICQWLPGLDNDLVRKLKDVLELTYLQKTNDFERGCGSVLSGVGGQM
jgi:HD-like signal output (HDOD) protein